MRVCHVATSSVWLDCLDLTAFGLPDANDPIARVLAIPGRLGGCQAHSLLTVHHEISIYVTMSRCDRSPALLRSEEQIE